MNIYVASSWRNYLQAGIVTMLRKIGHEVYDFRHPAPGNDGFSWKAIDPELGKLDKWPPTRWREVVQHPIAVAGYELDMGALKRCDACVGVLPFGRSASFEVGWAMAAGKWCYIVAFDDTEPELMFRECWILTEMNDLFEHFGEPGMPKEKPPRVAVSVSVGHSRDAPRPCIVCGAPESRSQYHSREELTRGGPYKSDPLCVSCWERRLVRNLREGAST